MRPWNYSQGRNCSVCGVPILNKNETGMCRIHAAVIAGKKRDKGPERRREVARAKVKRYRDRHPEKVSAHRHKEVLRLRHGEAMKKIAAKTKAWRTANPEEYKKWRRGWQNARTARTCDSYIIGLIRQKTGRGAREITGYEIDQYRKYIQALRDERKLRGKSSRGGPR